MKLRDTVIGKDDAISALSHTLLEKGDHNRRLTEKLAEVKNHQLKTHFLNEWFLVTKLSKMGPVDLLVRNMMMMKLSSGSSQTKQRNTTTS